MIELTAQPAPQNRPYFSNNTMADGGIYPWKLQAIRQPNNGVSGTCRYADLKNPLPEPPRDQAWVRDLSTQEWRLVPVAAAAVARESGGGEVGECAIATAVAVPNPDATAAPAGARHHDVAPTDTFQGLCLRYKVTPTELRRANRMMGSNLKLAPARLVIPSNDRNATLDASGAEMTKEEKIAALLSKVRYSVRTKLTYSEARAYLEISDWDVGAAVNDANEDFAS